LADEPTGNLHTEQGQMIMELFKTLHAEGMTIIKVTHAEGNAQYGTRIVRLSDGFIQKDTKVA
jgi:putative ABC transport system ATP-binding protein